MKRRKGWRELAGNLHRKNQTKYHATDEEYEYIAREAGGRPYQYVFDQRMFPRGWRKRLVELRNEQKAAGLDDNQFLSASVLATKGLRRVRSKIIPIKKRN